MLTVMRDPEAAFDVRFEAAKSAAPYIHPRLAAVEHSGDEDKPIAYQIVSGVPRPESVMNDSDSPGAEVQRH